jgi:plasmid stabilization system protein ParE
MNYGLVLTTRARADILRNAEWWAQNHSPDQAIAWFDSVYEQLESLRRMP